MEKYIRILREKGIKVTPRRKAILEFFLKYKVYSTPEQVWKYLKKKFKSAGLPSVYRNLAEFEKCGILTKIEGEEPRMYFGLCEEKNPFSHHHHIICHICHKVGSFRDCGLDLLKERIEKKTRFKVINHKLQITGICEDCLNKQKEGKT